jgi:3',5'-cyclic AMP phosphodiesterase CpdA
VRFAIISDPHLYNDRLGTSGPQFDAYMVSDLKLLKQSESILESALSSIATQHVQFLVVSGDLTKDGEILDHVLMTQHLQKLEKLGIQVFVVPGNHDINNPDAVIYLPDGTTRPVPSASPAVFRALYQRFGYGQALESDAASLSYLVEPVPGLWLLAIDSCDYQNNWQCGTPRVGGRLSPETMTWILAKIQEGQANGKQVIAVMHHGVNEHFLPEPLLFPDYLVDDWPTVSAQLADAGLKVVFTGHYHSQDAAYPLDEHLQLQQTLCDIETASLVQYPCAFRIVTLDGANLDVRSERITQISADTGGLPFQEFAENSLRSLLPIQVIQELMALFNLPREQAEQVAPFIVDALVANYAGDETPSPQVQQTIQYLLAQPEPYHTLGALLAGFWTDIPPSDNELSVPFSEFDSGRPGPILPPPPGGGGPNPPAP